jgi:hypothetical protein
LIIKILMDLMFETCPHSCPPGPNKPTYCGGNVVVSMRKDYTDPRFCTFKQAQEKVAGSARARRASRIEFFEVKG